MKSKTKRKIMIFIIFNILIISYYVTFAFLHFNTNNTGNNIENNSINFFTIKTYNGFNYKIKNNKYKITSKEELNKFCNLYTGFELSDEYDLSKNSIFIQTQACSSGSTSIDFTDVTIDKTVEFVTKTNTPDEVGISNMAYWYLVAIIPNSELSKVNTDEWKSPI